MHWRAVVVVIIAVGRVSKTVTGQLADTPTRGLDNSRSRRCRQKNEN